ncbi:MAG: HAMP domain-containing sensor histidine kinase [Patescibacteria group bacterium]|jgi:signal transduction histidine kinase
MKFHKTYLKLTGFYVLIVMAISIFFSISLYNISSNELDRGLGSQSRAIMGLSLRDDINHLLPNFEKIRLEQLESSNNNLQTNLIYFNILIFILSSAASYFLAKKTLEPIKEAMEAQNRFTADASHELRTPLTAMKAEIEVGLREKDLNLSSSKKLLSSSLEEIEKLESLSNDLLKVARYQEQETAELDKISLEEVIVESYQKVASLAEKKQIKFNNSLQNIYVKGDQKSLIELFVILLDNAIKYSPEKSTISIDIEKDDKFAQVKISDQGVGIKSSDIPYIFNRFYRADSSRSKENISGYGLGLSIAQRIVDLHKGKIQVISKPGKGSQFIVKLKF